MSTIRPEVWLPYVLSNLASAAGTFPANIVKPSPKIRAWRESFVAGLRSMRKVMPGAVRLPSGNHGLLLCRSAPELDLPQVRRA